MRGFKMFNLFPYKLSPVRTFWSQIVLTPEAKYSTSVSHSKNRACSDPRGLVMGPSWFHRIFLVEIDPDFSEGKSTLSHLYICSCLYGIFSMKVHSCKWRVKRDKKEINTSECFSCENKRYCCS